MKSATDLFNGLEEVYDVLGKSHVGERDLVAINRNWLKTRTQQQ